MRNHQEKNAGVDGSDKPYLLKFGSFTLDLQRHGLFRGNSRVHLTSKPFETLAVLVEHRGKTVGKQQLLDAVWKGAFVTEDSIVKAIREIRRVLEDEKSNPQFIQTVPGEGYRFIAEITRADPPEKPFDLISEDLNFKVAAEATVVPERVAGRLRVGFWVTAATLGLLTILVAVIFLRPSVDPESPHQRRISDDFPGSQTEASLSPDGNWLAFTSDHSEGIPQVWIQSMPRGKPHQLTVGDIPSHHASWSPNGGEIVFSRGADWQQDIWSISAFGGPPRILIEGGRNASWSRDGNRLVFEKDDEIWMANADGSGQHRVEGVPPNELLLVDREPSLSPDGSQIAFFQPEDGPMGDIWIIPSQGGWARQLTTDSHLGNGPVWTPDGRHILFSSQRRGSKNLWKIDESGGTPQPVTIGPGEQTDPEISRDGATLIYTNSSVHRTLTLLDPPAHRNSEIRETETDMYFPEFSQPVTRLPFSQL
jgi:DNA-binding winged helix-turn-helix (wHTH) protein/dipeptidyl aminopeptidase/acylaminoacyl peptidase